MRAAVIRGYGQPPDHVEHPVPAVGPGQVLLKVTAAPINPLDLLCASGTSYFGEPPLPYVPGTQGVGVVQAGSQWPAGTRVWFSADAGMAPGDGTLAELCVARESALLPLTGDVSDDLVAALGLSAIAAWMALTWRGGLSSGEHVLVLGASGTVGQVGIQAARLLGANQVTAACRDSHGRQRALELGADAVADMSGDDAGLLHGRLKQAMAGPADLVLDPVWGLPAEAAVRVLARGGRLVNLGSSAGPQARLDSAGLRSGTLGVLGYTNAALSPAQKAEALDEILRHAAAGRLTVDYETLPLADVASAWLRCGQPPHRKAVLLP
jgi:NADPH:quinone reductase-like Zn-dependent oxidoreductase